MRKYRFDLEAAGTVVLCLKEVLEAAGAESLLALLALSWFVEDVAAEAADNLRNEALDFLQVLDLGLVHHPL